MNKQLKLNKDGTIKGRGIEWTDYTWNPIAGCFHACQWTMPDGTVANCYAEDVANGIAGSAYPNGFEFNYWKPELLSEPLSQKKPSKIFVGSMADVFGHWVAEWSVIEILETCWQANWHTFQFLTKNPRNARNFGLPTNCWLGASTPPDFMWNKPLNPNQQRAMLVANLKALAESKASTTWLSAEPLSWDIVPILEDVDLCPKLVDWIVIGAASNGAKYYPPNETHVRKLVEFCDEHDIKVFFKGNLKSLKWAAANWREEFPAVKVATQ